MLSSRISVIAVNGVTWVGGKIDEPPTDRLGKRGDPDIYDKVRYDGKRSGEEPATFVHPQHTRYISRH